MCNDIIYAMKEREINQEQLSNAEKRKRVFLMHLRKRLGNGRFADTVAQIIAGITQ